MDRVISLDRSSGYGENFIVAPRVAGYRRSADRFCRFIVSTDDPFRFCYSRCPLDSPANIWKRGDATKMRRRAGGREGEKTWVNLETARRLFTKFRLVVSNGALIIDRSRARYSAETGGSDKILRKIYICRARRLRWRKSIRSPFLFFIIIVPRVACIFSLVVSQSRNFINICLKFRDRRLTTPPVRK